MINVNSEIKPLKKVLVHRPGNELLNLTPDSLQRLLFDDIPYLKIAQEEHDEFVTIMKDNGIEVVYLEDLMAEVLELNPNIREKFLRQYIYEADIKTPKFRDVVYDFLNGFKDNKELVLKTMEGININELTAMERDISHSLIDLITEESKFLADPMPNLVFTRDPFASIGNGISLNRMYAVTRCRETIYADYIFKYHPDYKNTVKYYNRDLPYHIEGGDILVLNENTLAIGISQRTQAESIETLASNLFKNDTSKVNTILAFKIPECRAFMHLDTVFTQIDHDKFTFHPGIMETLEVYEITPRLETVEKEDINVRKIEDSLENILEKYLGKDIKLIPCGAGDQIISEREQWNDASNTLCIAPGVVIVYDRNNITNTLLRREGIKVLEMHGSELSRGRGGPRCMSMPLIRED
ncbi:MAG: arginine deiminase [Mollicutes bacterium]|nr:arginine deiminase [Mollicutes bacterium]